MDRAREEEACATSSTASRAKFDRAGPGHTGERTIERRDRPSRPLLGFVRCCSPGHTSSTRLFAASWRGSSRAACEGDIEPTVAVIIAAYNEEPVIARRIENLLELDYPRDKLQIVVTLRRVERPHRGDRAPVPGVKVISNPRGGKVAAQDRAVRQTDSEIVAFSDANRTWSPDALRKLVRRSPIPRSPTSAASCASSTRTARNKEGVYWRYEMRAARRRVAARLGHRRQRIDLCGAPIGLRRGRPALRPRSVAAVPDGAARPARGLRAARRRRGRSRRRRTRPSTAARCGCSSTAG